MHKPKMKTYTFQVSWEIYDNVYFRESRIDGGVETVTVRTSKGETDAREKAELQVCHAKGADWVNIDD